MGFLGVCRTAFCYIPCKQHGLYIQRPVQVFLSLCHSFRRFPFSCKFTACPAQTARAGRSQVSFYGI